MIECNMSHGFGFSTVDNDAVAAVNELSPIQGMQTWHDSLNPPRPNAHSNEPQTLTLSFQEGWFLSYLSLYLEYWKGIFLLF